MAITEPIIVGVFDNASLADNAIQELEDAGFDNSQIYHSAQQSGHNGFMAGLKNLFTGEDTTTGDPKDVTNALTDRGFSDEEAGYYENEYRAGHAIVAIRANGRAQSAAQILMTNGARTYRQRDTNQADYANNAATPQTDYANNAQASYANNTAVNPNNNQSSYANNNTRTSQTEYADTAATNPNSAQTSYNNNATENPDTYQTDYANAGSANANPSQTRYTDADAYRSAHDTDTAADEQHQLHQHETQL